eukprot:gene17384-17214_t
MTQFIQSGDRRRTAAEVLDRAQRAAGGLQALGIGEDDVIALLLRNDFAFFEASLAAALLGAYATPINWHATPDEIGYILADSGAKVLIAHADLLPPLRDTLPEGLRVFRVETPDEIAAAYNVDPRRRAFADFADWDAFVRASAPRGGPAVLGPFMQTMAGGYGLSPATPMTVLMNGPMYHSAPNTYAMAAVQMGASIILQPRFEAEDLLALIEAHRITHMHIVPTMFHRLLSLPEAVRTRYDLSSLVDVVHGAAPCPPAAKRAMIAWWGPVISEYYGSTETALVARLTSPEALAHPGSVGRALPGVELIVVNSEGERLPPGEIGDIYVRSEVTSLFTYHGAPDKRAEIDLGGFADLFAMIGTSAQVSPASEFMQLARDHGADTVEMNLEPSAVAKAAGEVILGPATEV